MPESLDENSPVELMVVDEGIEALMGAEDSEDDGVPTSQASHPVDQQPHTILGLQVLIDQLVHWAPACWLLGFPIACCWLSAGLMGADQLRRRSQLITAGPFFTSCSRLAAATGMRRVPRLGVCEQIARPILIGIIRPMIHLPPVAIRQRVQSRRQF
jgi:hypothetical protein